MKKISLLTILFLLVIGVHTNTVAQVSSDFTKNNCVKKDNIIIDAIYGWPYFNGFLLKRLSSTYNLNNVRNTNHYGGRFELMIDEKIGLGGEFTYADASLNYQSGTNGNWEKVGVSKIRILGRLNYHFGTTEKVDPYLALGAGYKKTTIYDTGHTDLNETINLFPVSFKFAFGMRVYFDDLIGLNAEIGIGGPLISAGFTLKI